MSQTISSSHGTLEERFSYILQPIRDLAKNWNVDIAHFLEEYLEDLGKVEITFDDGATTMNFSEAALLIQGSAGVYAKKVEYLYSLVFQVLDLVSQKKKSNNGTGEDGADDNGERGDNDEQFLPLDDIPEKEGLYTKEHDVSSNKSVRPVPEMPTRLIPLEESEKGDNALYNKKGEIMGNHCDFNTDISYINTDGSLLLEMRDRLLLGTDFRQALMAQPSVEDMNCDDGGDNFAFPSMNDNDDVNNDGPQPFQDGVGLVSDGDDAIDNQHRAHDKGASVVARDQRKRVTLASLPSKPAAVDLWLLLDPHDKGMTADKPFRKKKPFKIPSGLDDFTKKRKKAKVKIELPPIDEFAEKFFSHRAKFPKNPLKVPDFPELEDAFWQEHKHREVIKKEEIKKLKKEEGEQLEAVEDNEEADCQDAELPFDAEDCDEDDIPPLQLDAHLFNGHTSNRWAGSNLSPGDDITLSYEDLVLKHVEKFLASAAEYAQITELSRRVCEWEEKIKPTLEEQERHEAFDIHKYGSFIIERLVRGEKRAFKELVKGKQEFEICRYTLATLQLANVYNIELSTIPDISGSIMDCLYVTLLSTKRHFQDLEEYIVPSLKEA